MSQLIDGKALSLSLKSKMKEQMPELREKYGRVPCLAVIIVGNNPASRSYVSSKIKAAEFIGMDGKLIEFPETVSEKELIGCISDLNDDSEVDGILVQLPLPKHIDEDKIIDTISVDKDVDGFHPQNVAKLWLGRKCILPCTPNGIIALLDSIHVEISSKRAVVVGRSNIVGKPVAKLLMDRNATVTIAHSRTLNLAELTREADILVVAVGNPGMIKGDMIKPGAVVIDVGFSRVPIAAGESRAAAEAGAVQYRLCGDVDFESASKVASFISPVPGGVGPMTIAMLMKNTIDCFLASRD